MAYRLIVTAYNLAWLFYNIHLKGAKLFIYLTNWTYTILNIYFIFATTLSCIALYKDLKKETETTALTTDAHKEKIEMEPGDYGAVDQDREDASEKDALQCHHKFFWLVHVIAATASLWITAGYWSVLRGDDLVDANNITKHALNSVFMVIDTCLSAIPVRLFHSIYPFLRLNFQFSQLRGGSAGTRSVRRRSSVTFLTEYRWTVGSVSLKLLKISVLYKSF